MDPQKATAKESQQKQSLGLIDAMMDDPGREARIAIEKAAEEARDNSRDIRIKRPMSIEERILLSLYCEPEATE